MTPQKLEEKGPLRRYAKAVNSLIDFAQSLKIQRGLGYSVRHSSHGQLLHINQQDVPAPAPSEPGVIKRFVVKQIRATYLVCNEVAEWGEELTQTQYKIAKPESLRFYEASVVYNELADGVTSFFTQKHVIQGATDFNYRRLSLTNPLQTGQAWFLQKINPIYETNGQRGIVNIYAASIPNIIQDENLAAINWIDLNVDARKWTVPLRYSSACSEIYNAQIQGYETVTSPMLTPYSIDRIAL